MKTREEFEKAVDYLVSVESDLLELETIHNEIEILLKKMWDKSRDIKEFSHYAKSIIEWEINK